MVYAIKAYFDGAGAGSKNLYAGNKKIHVATQKGPVSVGNPIGVKNTFMAACTNTVAIIPHAHHIAAFHEKLQNVAPNAIPVKTAENP